MEAITTNLTHEQFRTLYYLARQCGYMNLSDMWDVFEYSHTKTLFIDDNYQLHSGGLIPSNVIVGALSYEDFIRYMTETDAGLSLSDISDVKVHGTIPLGTLVYVNNDSHMRGQVLEVTGNIQETNADYPNELKNGLGGGWDIASLRLPTPTEIRAYFNVSFKKVNNDGNVTKLNKDEVQNKSKEISTRSGTSTIRPRRRAVQITSSSGLIGNKIKSIKGRSKARQAKICSSILLVSRS